MLRHPFSPDLCQKQSLVYQQRYQVECAPVVMRCLKEQGVGWSEWSLKDYMTLTMRLWLLKRSEQMDKFYLVESWLFGKLAEWWLSSAMAVVYFGRGLPFSLPTFPCADLVCVWCKQSTELGKVAAGVRQSWAWCSGSTFRAMFPSVHAMEKQYLYDS